MPWEVGKEEHAIQIHVACTANARGCGLWHVRTMFHVMYPKRLQENSFDRNKIMSCKFPLHDSLILANNKFMSCVPLHDQK